MKTGAAALVIFVFMALQAAGELRITEFVTNTDSDWVEIQFTSGTKESMDISSLFVTMYYGSNEPLGTEPITLYSYDRPETEYDDRFAVVHLTESARPDETDSTGDTNRNGCIDIYCNNYYASLWNSDCVIAIDSDDDPSNGGIIDFVAYSDRDGSPNSTITSYIEQAISQGQWRNCGSDNIQDCCFNIGTGGCDPLVSVARKNGTDSNGPEDFVITKYVTPGRENLVSVNKKGKSLFRILKKKVRIVPGRGAEGNKIPLFLYESCDIKLRIFTLTGIMVHDSDLYKSAVPGNFFLNWKVKKRSIPGGLYLGFVEASSASMKKSESDTMYIFVGP